MVTLLFLCRTDQNLWLISVFKDKKSLIITFCKEYLSYSYNELSYMPFCALGLISMRIVIIVFSLYWL